MISKSTLALLALAALLPRPTPAAVPASKAGAPGSKATAPATDGPRIMTLQTLDGLSKSDRSAAFAEYVLAYRSATAARNEARARELAERATKLWPDRSRPWLHLAAARLQLEQWGPAIEAARAADKARPDDDPPTPLPEEMHAAAGYWEGLALYRTQRNTEALPRLRATRTAMPEWAEAARALGETEFVAGHSREAAAAYGAAFDLDPELLGARDLSFLSEARAASDDLDGGVAALQEALRRAPFEPGLHAKLGDLLRREGHESEAYYELVHELLLQGVEGRFAPPTISMTQQIVQQVAKSKDDPDRAELLAVSAGLQHLDAGETAAALQHLQQALQLTRTVSPVPRLLYADALRRNDQTDKSRDELQRLLAADPDLVPALYALSEVETKLGHPRESEAALARAKTLFPDYWKLKAKPAAN